MDDARRYLTSHRSGASALHHKAVISQHAFLLREPEPRIQPCSQWDPTSFLLQPLPDEFLIDAHRVTPGQGQARIPHWSMGDSCSYRTEDDARLSTTCRSFTQHCQDCLGQAGSSRADSRRSRRLLPCRLRHGSHQRRRKVSRRLRAAPETGLSLDLRASSSAASPLYWLG